jgi:hypothetical protein
LKKARWILLGRRKTCVLPSRNFPNSNATTFHQEEPYNPIPPILCSSTLFVQATMATYPVDIPALPPLASGTNDNPAPAIFEGDPLEEGHVATATIQHQTRKLLLEASPLLATQEEVVASKGRKHSVESANFDKGAPLWAENLQQNLQEQMAAMQQNLQNMEGQMTKMLQNMEGQMTKMQQNLEGRFTKMLQNLEGQLNGFQQQRQQGFQLIIREIQQESQRSMNRSRQSTEESIDVLVRVEDGQFPDQQDPAIWFPIDQNILTEATVIQLDALLGFYHQNVTGTRAEKVNRLKRFLGVTL